MGDCLIGGLGKGTIPTHKDRTRPAEEATDVDAEGEVHSCLPFPITPSMEACRQETERKK